MGMERGLFYVSGTELVSHSRTINSYLVSLLASSSDRNSDSRLADVQPLDVNRLLSSLDSRRGNIRGNYRFIAVAAVAKNRLEVSNASDPAR